MSVFGRIFDVGNRNPLPVQESYIQFQNPDGTERLRMVPDTSAAAIAARHSMGLIYGANNTPRDFGMRGVIEVKDPATGNFVPVTGNSRGVPSQDAQLAMLQSFRETGVIGPQPVNPDGSNAVGGSGGGGGAQAASAAVSPSGDTGTSTPDAADALGSGPLGPRRAVLEPEEPLDLTLPLIPEPTDPLIVPGSNLDQLDQTGPAATTNSLFAEPELQQPEGVFAAPPVTPQAPTQDAGVSPVGASAGFLRPERAPRRGIRASNQEGNARFAITRGANSPFSTF